MSSHNIVPKRIQKKQNRLHNLAQLQWMVVLICFLFHFQHVLAAAVVVSADNNDTIPKSPSQSKTPSSISSTSTPTNNTAPSNPPPPAEQLPVLQDNFDSSSDSLCLWQDDVGNLYNLSLLTKSEGYWEVSQRATEKQHFEIKLLFNFCSNFPKLDCNTPAKQDSNALDGQDTQTQEKNSMLNKDSANTAQDQQADIEQKQEQSLQYGAYQSVTVYGKQSQCDGFGRADRTVIELIDYYEVGRGLKVVYRGGEICQSSENPLDINSERTITFLVECPYNQPNGNSSKNQNTTTTAAVTTTEGSEQFKQLELDGISITSCHPVLTIDHLAGCYMGQKKAQENKLQHPVFVFVFLLALTFAGLFVAIVTAFNCTTCQIRSFSAIPFYDTIKFYLEDSSKINSSNGRTDVLSCLWGNKDSHKPI